MLIQEIGLITSKLSTLTNLTKMTFLVSRPRVGVCYLSRDLSRDHIILKIIEELLYHRNVSADSARFAISSKPLD